MVVPFRRGHPGDFTVSVVRRYRPETLAAVGREQPPPSVRDPAVILDRPPRRSAAAEGAGRPWRWLEAAAAVFAALCVVALSTAPQLVEPDDYAYRASIVAATEGHWLTLSTAQVTRWPRSSPRSSRPAVGRGPSGGPRPSSSGSSCPTDAGSARRTPATRSWPRRSSRSASSGWPPCSTGRWAAWACSPAPGAGSADIGGAAAVGLFCSSGAALLFAWRDYMPTFTDASLIAAGTGALLWALLADEAIRAAAHLDRAARIPGHRGRGVRPLHRHRRARLRRRGRAGGPVAAGREPASRGAGLVARLGRGCSARAWPRSTTWSTAARSNPATRPARSRSASARSCPTSGTCPRT